MADYALPRLRLAASLALTLLAGCAASQPIRFQAESPRVREEVQALTELVRAGWHLPLRVQVFLSNAEDGRPLPPAQLASEEGLALRQLAEVRAAYMSTPFDFYAVDVEVGPGVGEAEVELDADALQLRLRLPADAGAAPLTAPAILDALAGGYRWRRSGRWYEGERTQDLSRALRRDLEKLQVLHDELDLEVNRLALLGGTLLARRARDEPAVLTPSEADYARAAQFQATFALHRVLNTLARWRLASEDPRFSFPREALAALVYARELHQGYLDRLLEVLVGGRTKLALWREDFWHRNPIYEALDAGAAPPTLPGRELPPDIPAGSVRALLSLRLDGDLRDWFQELDRRWASRPALSGASPLAAQVGAVEARLAQVRALGEGGIDGFTAWKELWDARLKGAAAVPFYGLVRLVSRFLGSTRTSHPPPAVSAAQLSALAQELRPGDVVLVRQDHYLSNAFLPGFWSHALLHLGSFESWSRLRLLDGTTLGDDPLVRPLASRFRPVDGHPPARVVEAISEGVVLNSLEHSVQKDYVLVLRPELPEGAVAEAIRRALRFLGRPYDFSFDFASDDKLVCTELVHRAYDPALGLAPPGASPAVPGLVEVLGRVTLPANELARYALYMQEHPEPRREDGYPGRRLRLVALVDRRPDGGAELLRGEAALARLRESIAR